MPRAVLDSSVLVSAFLSPSGTPATLLARAGEGLFTLCLSHELLAETSAVLLRPKHQKGRCYTPDLVARFRSDLTASADMVTELPTLRVVPGDPKDDLVVATAVAARADFLVTGDRRHLLPLGTHGGVRIVTPREFLGLLAK